MSEGSVRKGSVSKGSASKESGKAARPAGVRSGKAVHGRKGDVLLVIDVVNDLAFPGAEKVLPWAEKLAGKLAKFRAGARRVGMPVVYANDNFGLWHASFEEVYRHCTRKSARGAAVSRRLRPGREDYFILKPRHSAFFASSLLPLLEDLGARRLILAGIATNLCVLFTAHDAHMHGYKMVVLSDCCAAESDSDHNVALRQLRDFCGATVCLSGDYRFAKAK